MVSVKDFPGYVLDPTHEVVMHSGLDLYAGDAFFSYKKPLSHERGSERSERANK